MAFQWSSRPGLRILGSKVRKEVPLLLEINSKISRILVGSSNCYGLSQMDSLSIICNWLPAEWITSAIPQIYSSSSIQGKSKIFNSQHIRIWTFSISRTVDFYLLTPSNHHKQNLINFSKVSSSRWLDPLAACNSNIWDNSCHQGEQTVKLLIPRHLVHLYRTLNKSAVGISPLRTTSAPLLTKLSSSKLLSSKLLKACCSPKIRSKQIYSQT